MTIGDKAAFVRIDEDSGKLEIIWRDRSKSVPVGASFPSSAIGFMLLSDGRVLKTLDGGRNWTDGRRLPDGIIGKVADLVFVDESVGVVCGSDGLIAKTNDGGNTWVESRIDEGEFLFQILAGKGSYLWVLDSPSKIWFSSDLGNSWRRVDDERLLAESVNSRAVIHRERLWIPNGDSLLVISSEAMDSEGAP